MSWLVVLWLVVFSGSPDSRKQQVASDILARKGKILENYKDERVSLQTVAAVVCFCLFLLLVVVAAAPVVTTLLLLCCFVIAVACTCMLFFPSITTDNGRQVFCPVR